MANEIEKVNTIEIADIEKISGRTDDNIEKLSGLEFTGFTPPAWGNTRAVIAGGSGSGTNDITRIQYKTVGAEATAENFGDLQTSRARHQYAGSNGTRGIFGGGGGLSGESIVRGVPDTDYITIASTGNGSDFGDVYAAATYGGRCGGSNGTLTFSVGGYYGAASVNIDNMEYYTIASTGNGTSAGTLSGARSSPNCTNGDTRYIANGGYSSGQLDVMEYNDFSTSANVTDFGDLSSGSNTNSNVCSTVRAVLHCPVIGKEHMEYVTVASTGDATDFGDMDVNRDSSTATSDGATGEFFGGYDSGVLTSTEKITIGSTGNGTEVGDLMEGNKHAGATSGI